VGITMANPSYVRPQSENQVTGNQEYRSLQNRVRDAEASLPAESDAATQVGMAT
jgi:hypothetical protein